MNENFLETLPKRFRENIRALPDFNSEKWIEELSETICIVEKKWALNAGICFDNLSFNYVAPCFLANGEKAVLKVSIPYLKKELENEVRALIQFEGKGAPKLLKVDEELNVLLLERLFPGKHLAAICENDKNKAVEIAIDCLKMIQTKPPRDIKFPELNLWFSNLDIKLRSFQSDEFSKASSYLRELNADTREHLLLHADFHHQNILSADNGRYLAIDPKGMIGNVGYDIAVFLNNHAFFVRSQPDFQKLLNQATRQFSEAFQLPLETIKRWAYAQQILASWWSFEDCDKNWRANLKVAQIWE